MENDSTCFSLCKRDNHSNAVPSPINLKISRKCPTRTASKCPKHLMLPNYNTLSIFIFADLKRLELLQQHPECWVLPLHHRSKWSGKKDSNLREVTPLASRARPLPDYGAISRYIAAPVGLEPTSHDYGISSKG